jgi:hypothetical protein
MEEGFGTGEHFGLGEAASMELFFGESFRGRANPVVRREKHHHLPRPKPSLNIV